VDGAIHEAGGPAIVAECREIVSKIGQLPPGGAVITTGGRLKARYVIHTVGPIYRGARNHEPELLASCHRESIRLAEERALNSLAFPAISTGAYGYPVPDAAVIALTSTMEALQATQHVMKCRFVLFDASTLQSFERIAGKLQKSNSFRIEKV
jgi:O-acetyl-ADP-ribose deacetylase (regulator of RNase III)